MNNALLQDYFIETFDLEHQKHKRPGYFDLDNTLQHRQLIVQDAKVQEGLKQEYRQCVSSFEEAKRDV